MLMGEQIVKLTYPEIRELKTADFGKEANLTAYIEEHIQRFVDEILEDVLIEYSTEYQFDRASFGPRAPRVDFYITGQRKDYLIECKNPKHPAENRHAIGQLLNYGRKHNKPCELVIVSTLYDDDTAKTIGHWNLPIKYIYFEKEKALIYKGEWKDGS